MRQRLRPKYSDEELKKIYAAPHDHKKWHDHIIRVDATVALGKWLAKEKQISSIADLSCGNAHIIREIGSDVPVKNIHAGDYAPGYQYQGPIEETINQIPLVDLFICSETLEHLDDPDTVLKQIRHKSNYLIVSTPQDAFFENNPEHYWAWSKVELQKMFASSGWYPITYVQLDLGLFDPNYYCYQIWLCE